MSFVMIAFTSYVCIRSSIFELLELCSFLESIGERMAVRNTYCTHLVLASKISMALFQLRRDHLLDFSNW